MSMRAILCLFLVGCGDATQDMPDFAGPDLSMPPDFAPYLDLRPPPDIAAHDLIWTVQSTNTPKEDYYGVWGAEGEVFLCGHSNVGGLIYHSTDDGMTWDQQASGTLVVLHEVWGTAIDDVFTAGENGTVQHSSNHGTNWQRVQTGMMPVANLYAIHGSIGGEIWIAGDTGTLWKSSNGGVVWNREFSNTPNTLRRAWRAGAVTRDMWVVGDLGTILHQSGGGMWNVETSGTMANLGGVWGSSEKDVYAVGAGGTLLHTGDLGANWKAVAGPWGMSDLSAVWGSDANDVYVAADGLGIFHSKDGTNWTIAKPDTGSFTAIWGSGPFDVFVVGKAGLILHGQ
jgi:photosystem II stability/assembly factor-like uncharacterized protein